MREEERILSTFTEQHRALVSFQRYLIRDDGSESKIDKPYTRQYTVNSDFEKQRIQEELPQDIQNSIFAVLQPMQEQ